MKAGQKVVCIDDNFPAWVLPYYSELPKKGRTYVIRDVVLGTDVTAQSRGEVALYLIGINGRDSDTEPYPEAGFNAERFRPLEETPASEETHEYFEEWIEKEDGSRVLRVHVTQKV